MQSNEQSSSSNERVFADLTAYAASKVVNAMLAKAGVKPNVTSQWMYSKALHGSLGAYRDATNADKWTFDGAEFAKWAKRYVESRVNGTATNSRTDYVALADSYEL
jgi:hypothetical protein